MGIYDENGELTDEYLPKVIAEAGAVKIYSDGTASGGLTVELGQLGMARILADAVRRVREELAERYDNVEWGAAFQKNMDRLTDRIEAVEKAIQDTRIDQGEMGLVSEQEARNTIKHIEAVREEGVSGHNHLADRVAALENGVKAVDRAERSRCEMEGTQLWPLVYGLIERLDALESRQLDPPSNLRARESGPKQDEAGEGAGHTDQELLDYRKQGWDDGRHELAREIVERLRGDRGPDIATADWIEREYLKEEG